MTTDNDINDIIRKLNDPAVQARVRSAIKKATTDELASAGIELTPAIWGELSARLMTQPRDAGDVLAGAAAVAIGIAISDARFKSKIEYVGTTPGGIRLHEFSYRGFTTRWRGVLAQEIETSHPDAVLRDVDGILSVDYRRLEVDMVAV